MKGKSLSSGLALGVFLLAGCAGMVVRGPTEAEFQQADFGSAPTNQEKLITDYLNSTLKDPYSAHISIGTPEKDYWGHVGNVFVARELNFGWCSVARVNAKNSYGAYVGEKAYRFCFRQGSIAHVDAPTTHEALQSLCRQCVPQSYE